MRLTTWQGEPYGEAGERRGQRPDGSMSLLLRLMGNPLDADYAEAARRRRVRAAPRHESGKVVLSAVLLCMGIFTAVAVAQAREQPITSDQRDRLVNEIEERTAYTDRLQRQLVSLRRQIAEMRGARLAKTERGQRARARLDRLDLAAAVTPVQGPGMVVTLDNPQPEEDGITAPDTATASGRVLDEDLQMLVDALWSAGAEAVAVDGQRVTSLTAIRSAGEAVLVNYRPIDPPYRVTAVGDPDSLRSRLADSAAGRRFHTLRANLGIEYTVEKRGHVRLPGASGVSLRYAREVKQE